MTPAHLLFTSWRHNLVPVIEVTLNLTGTASPADYRIYTDENCMGIYYSITWQSGGDLVVLIPVGRESVGIIVQAVDDTIVERLYETLDITIVSAKNQWDSNINYAFAKYEPEKKTLLAPTMSPIMSRRRGVYFTSRSRIMIPWACKRWCFRVFMRLFNQTQTRLPDKRSLGCTGQ